MRQKRMICLTVLIGITLCFMPMLISVVPVTAQEVITEDKQTDEYWDNVLNIQQDLRYRNILQYGMTPIYGMDIADGKYKIDAVSNSSFFKITEAYLIADKGSLTAEITIPSMSYLYVYMGTAAKANNDPEHRISFREKENHTVFKILVEALNKEIDCAAYSKARKKWYDRKLVFDAASLPEEACRFKIPDYQLISDAIKSYGRDDVEYLEAIARDDERRNPLENEENPDEWLMSGTPEPVEVNYPDGEYSIEVNMIGGSGRASVSSPTWLIVRDGKAYARLLWSSSYYDYMLIGDTMYYNRTTDGGNSVFEIPIAVMDESMPVIADTTAMGEPIEIRYELTFYSTTIGSKGNIPQEAAKKY